MRGRPRGKFLSGYVESKKDSKGLPYLVYVQPFWVEHKDAHGQVMPKKYKVQSDRFLDKDNQRAVRFAQNQAIQRAESRRTALEGSRPKGRTAHVETLAETIQKYLDQIQTFDRFQKSRPAKANTRATFGTYLNRAQTVQPVIADLEWSDLTLALIDEHLKVAAMQLNATTCAKYKSGLSTVGNYALDRGLWSENLFRRSKAYRRKGAGFKRDQVENTVLTLEQIRDLHIEAEKMGPNYRLAIKLLRLGLRANEVLAITEDKLNFVEQSIDLAYSLTCDKPDWAGDRASIVYLDDLKTNLSASRIYIGKPLMDEIRQKLALSKSYVVPSFDDLGKDIERKFVITNKQGHAWRYDNFLRAIKILYERAQVNIDVTGSKSRYNHIWRNSYASDLVALKADDMQIRSLMRHADAGTSKEIYAAARKNDIQNYAAYAAQIKTTKDFNFIIQKIDYDMIDWKKNVLKPFQSLLDVKPGTVDANETFEFEVEGAKPLVPINKGRRAYFANRART